MGWFSEVTDFLSSPGFRIGAGIAGLASGAGAFGDMGGWGTALQGLSGAANLASGAASTFGPGRSDLDKATGALQLGLGGYNIGQSLGAVGTFGDVWNQISGGGGSVDNTVTRQPLAPFPGTEGGFTITPPSASADNFQLSSGTAQPGYTGPASDMSGTGSGDLAQVPPPSPDGVQQLIPDPDAPIQLSDGTWRDPRTGRVVPGPNQTATIPPNPAAVSPPPPPPPPPVRRAATTPAVSPPAAPPAVTPPAPAAAGPTSAIPPIPTPGRNVSQAQPVRLNWFDRTWDNLLNAAEQNPVGAAMQALQIGGMLTGLFAQSRGDIAREALENMDPNSPNGTEFRRLYEERARKEIEDRANEVRSSLEAKFAGRGMLRSTVYTNALNSLEQARIKLLADLPLTSLNAWNATPQGSGRGLQAAGSYAQATAPTMDFSSMTRVLGQSPFTQQLAAGQR